MKKRIFIVAGESSGDMHAASLMRELKEIIPGISFTGIGGGQMKKEGLDEIYNMKEVNFIGFSSVIKNFPAIKKILNDCVKNIKSTSPDAVILTDFPGFNLKLISEIGKFYKGRIIYYISPQLWAWHKSRVKTIKQYVDLMITVFPFEVDFYKNENVHAEFAGHPLIKKVNEFLSKNKKQKKDKFQIGLLPGSRSGEIERILPALVDASRLFKQRLDCEINLICSTNQTRSYYEAFAGKDINLIYDSDNKDLNYKTILDSDFIITKAGTSTMECALIGTPFCVVYKAGKINYVIGKRLIKVDNIAMPNILLGKNIVREFVQNEMTPENIFEEGEKVLMNKEYAAKMRNEFTKLRTLLTDRDASKNAAKLVAGLFHQSENLH